MTHSTARRNKNAYSEDASKLIRENMKCPVCLEVLLPPIYQCETGHNICHLCVDEVSECPLCKSDYGDTRNYFAEELVNSMTFPCKYEEYGCHKLFLGSQLKDHQANCECQPYRCPELACQEVVGIHQMPKHLDKHGFKVMKGDVHQASLEILDDHFERKTEYNPWRISAFEKEFYTVSMRSRDGLWYFWAYGLGVKKEMKKYSYEIVLYSDEKQIMYRGTIQSLRINPEDVIKHGNCLITTDHVMKSIRNGGRINCQVYFIQGKNWDAVKRTTPGPKRVVKKPKTKKIKKSSKSLENRCGTCHNNKNRNAFSTSPYTCSLLSNQASSTSTQPSTSRTLSILSAKASPMELLKKELDLNGSRVINKLSTANEKLAKIAKTLTAMRTSASDEENTFVRRMRETLVCPSCNVEITPPIFQCELGHNVCHKCRISRQDCSLCLSPLTDCRNFFAEELLYRTCQRCLYAKYGCTVSLPSVQMKCHEAICDYAPFECPFNVCRKLVRSEDLMEHMKTHQISVINNEISSEVAVPKSPPTSTSSSIPKILMVGKVAFYPVIVRETDGNWLFYVITHNYRQYRFQIFFKKQAKTLAYQGPVLSLRSSHNPVKVKGDAVVLTEKAIKGLRAYEKLAYHIKINKVEPTADGKATTLGLPTSWVLSSRAGEIVSKTELFANKKTSMSTNDDSDDDDVTSSLHTEDVQRDSSDEVDESDVDDFTHSQTQFLSETSLATTQDDLESRKSRESISSIMTTASRKSNVRPGTPQRSSVSSFTSLKAKEAQSPEIDASDDERIEEQLSKRNAASSTVLKNVAKTGMPKTFEMNNPGKINGRMSHSSESLSANEREPRQLLSIPLSILKGTEDSLTEDLLSVTNRIKATDFQAKRTRSTSKQRVRLSDQVICCGEKNLKKRDLNGNCFSKSQTELTVSSSKASVRTVPSKHILSVQVRDDNDNTPEDSTVTNEFKELEQALSASNPDQEFMADVDLLSVKSLNEVTEAVISGGFDVVKSVISLFTSDSPQNPKESKETLEPDNSKL